MSGQRWLREGFERHQAGDLTAAATLYRRAARDGATKADALHGLGLVELQRGRPEPAIEALERATRLAPRNAAMLTNLGHALLAQQRFADALPVLTRAAELAPQAETHFNMAYAQQAAGQPFAAERSYREALSLEPRHAGARNNLAGLLHSLGRIEDAVSAYREALVLQPDNPDIRINLARAEEIAGDLTAAADTAGALARALPQDPRPQLLLARIARRNGEAESAEQRLRPLLQAALPDDLACTVRKELAVLLDQQGDYAGAFAMAADGNACRRRQAVRQGLDGRDWLRRVGRYADLFASQPRPRSVVQDQRQAPVFFVGFPRSGTTLMETILATHPGLVTSGEITPLDHVLRTLAPSGRADDVCTAIAGLDAAATATLRQVFWTAADGLFPGRLADRRLVDKAPFNLVELGLIERLFPDAPVIVAGRDPRDVCLSCFFQDFSLSDAVVNFLDIADAARAYVAVQALWSRYQEHLALPWVHYRYEELVAEPAAVAARIFDFLGLDWQPGRLADRGKRQGGPFIATPSRDAVDRPITATAVARWRRYQDDLEPALPILSDTVRELGYDAV